MIVAGLDFLFRLSHTGRRKSIEPRRINIYLRKYISAIEAEGFTVRPMSLNQNTFVRVSVILRRVTKILTIDRSLNLVLNGTIYPTVDDFKLLA